MPLVDGEEHGRAMNLLDQLENARLENLLNYMRALPDKAQEAIAEKGQAPADLMRQFDDPDLIRALQTHLRRLAGLAIAEAEDKDWQQLGEEALRNRDLTTLRRWAFLQQAFSAKLDGRLTQDRVAEFVDTFGVFWLPEEPSFVGGLLTAPAEAESAFRNGVELQIALTNLYAECRTLAGEAWPPDEPPHPVAGQWAWTGVMPCKMYVNPASDEITFVYPDGETFVQRICKIGPDYLMAYELRWRVEGSGELPDRRLTGGVPFGGVMEPESETNLDPLMPYSDYGPNVYFALTLYRRPGKGSRKLLVFRTEMQGETLTKETLLAPDGGFWSKLGVAAEYHPEKTGFRRVNDKLKP